jgi:hypothetical protein
MIPAGDARHRGRRQFILVASIFIVPLATAFLLYYSSGWRPMVNAHGMLIDPPRSLSVAGIALADGRSAPPDVFQGHWSLVYPADACNERTGELLDELARVRVALDKDAGRVRRVLLHGGQCASFEFPSQDADLLVLSAAGPAGEAFRAQFPLAVDGGHGIYIVDPHGNLMMSYPAAGSARGLLTDLERLLRLSNIG